MKIDDADLAGHPNAFWFLLPIVWFLVAVQEIMWIAVFVGTIPFPTILALILMRSKRDRIAIRQASRSFLLGFLAVCFLGLVFAIVQLIRQTFGV